MRGPHQPLAPKPRQVSSFIQLERATHPRRTARTNCSGELLKGLLCLIPVRSSFLSGELLLSMWLIEHVADSSFPVLPVGFGRSASTTRAFWINRKGPP